jgi:hypothetical protein
MLLQSGSSPVFMCYQASSCSFCHFMQLIHSGFELTGRARLSDSFSFSELGTVAVL